MDQHTDIRLSLPSKGRLAQATLDFLADCGLRVDKPNPRQYAARIPALPGLTVLFQRPGDIVVSVRDGSVDFGITGMDVVAEPGMDQPASYQFGKLSSDAPLVWVRIREGKVVLSRRFGGSRTTWSGESLTDAASVQADRRPAP